MLGTGFLSEVMKLCAMDCGDGCTVLNTLKTTELYVMNGRIVRCVNYISVRCLKMIGETGCGTWGNSGYHLHVLSVILKLLA